MDTSLKSIVKVKVEKNLVVTTTNVPKNKQISHKSWVQAWFMHLVFESFVQLHEANLTLQIKNKES